MRTECPIRDEGDGLGCNPASPESRANPIPDLSGSPINVSHRLKAHAAGGVGFQPMTDVNRRTAEIGYWLGASYWGRGIATEAVTLVTDWAFAAHEFLRIFAQPFAGNLASRRVLEKAGYQLEGTMRCSAVKDGEVRDQCMFARLRSH